MPSADRDGSKRYATTAAEWAERNAARLDELKHSAESARAAVESARGRATSPDRSVEAIVDARGEVASLKLSAAAMSKRPSELAEIVVSTIKSAHRASAADLRAKLKASGVSVGGDEILRAIGPDSSIDPPVESTEEDDHRPWVRRSILQDP